MTRFTDAVSLQPVFQQGHLPKFDPRKGVSDFGVSQRTVDVRPLEKPRARVPVGTARHGQRSR